MKSMPWTTSSYPSCLLQPHRTIRTSRSLQHHHPSHHLLHDDRRHLNRAPLLVYLLHRPKPSLDGRLREASIHYATLSSAAPLPRTLNPSSGSRRCRERMLPLVQRIGAGCAYRPHLYFSSWRETDPDMHVDRCTSPISERCWNPPTDKVFGVAEKKTRSRRYRR